ncbi:MAG: hypothetical protein LBS53_13385 [Synergistaceae bacterium]|jgi:hypothetical protein|nr:hypothetical protein [Synergistaceae bacterium]
MRVQIQIAYQRVYFWLASTLFYWLLIYMASAAARFRAFVAIGIIEHLAKREGLGAIMKNIESIEGEAWLSMANAGPAHGEYAVVSVITAAVLIITPFVMRMDNKGPIQGAVFLPCSIFLAYFYASVLNVITAAGMCWIISLNSGLRIGPDALTFMIHPLYLFTPRLIGSASGTFSQVLYLVYVYSVLSTPNKAPEEAVVRTEEEIEDESAEEWNKTACTMEMDRLTRMIGAKVQNPALVETIRKDLSDYINKSPELRDDMEEGTPHYKTILVQAAASARRIVTANPQDTSAREALLFSADEMERMEYITAAEHEAVRVWLENAAASETPPDSTESPAGTPVEDADSVNKSASP